MCMGGTIAVEGLDSVGETALLILSSHSWGLVAPRRKVAEEPNPDAARAVLLLAQEINGLRRH